MLGGQNCEYCSIVSGRCRPHLSDGYTKAVVNVYNKPIIVYTMQKFQNHPEIDAIMIACLKGWENMVQAYAKQFHIDKLKWIITGGLTGQDTSKLAADELSKSCGDEDIVIIHDSIRPLVSDEIISDSIRVCKEKGMGISSVSSMDNVMLTNDGESGLQSISRYTFRRIQTPQTYPLGDLRKFHEEAAAERNSLCQSSSCLLMINQS